MSKFGYFLSDGLISYNIPEELPKGDYNFTIFISDDSGNQACDTVIFRVRSRILYIFIPLIIISVVVIHVKKKYFGLAI